MINQFIFTDYCENIFLLKHLLEVLESKNELSQLFIKYDENTMSKTELFLFLPPGFPNGSIHRSYHRCCRGDKPLIHSPLSGLRGSGFSEIYASHHILSLDSHGGHDAGIRGLQSSTLCHGRRSHGFLYHHRHSYHTPPLKKSSSCARCLDSGFADDSRGIFCFN